MKLANLLMKVGLAYMAGAPVVFLLSWGQAQVKFPNGQVGILNALAAPMTLADLFYGLAVGFIIFGMGLFWKITDNIPDTLGLETKQE